MSRCIVIFQSSGVSVTLNGDIQVFWGVTLYREIQLLWGVTLNHDIRGLWDVTLYREIERSVLTERYELYPLNNPN